MYRFSWFAVEANHFQEVMVGNLRRRAKEAGLLLPVYAMRNRSSKQSRIAGLEPEVTQGRIRLCRRHQMLLNQLRQFPLAAHDDGPDALEMAIHVARAPVVEEGSLEIVILNFPFDRPGCEGVSMLQPTTRPEQAASFAVRRRFTVRVVVG